MSNPEVEMIKSRLAKVEKETSILKVKIDKRFDDIEEKQDLILAYLKGDRLGLNKGIQSDLIQLIEDGRRFAPLSDDRFSAITFYKANIGEVTELVDYWKGNKKNVKGSATLFGNTKVVLAVVGVILPFFYTIFNIVLSDWLKPIIDNLLNRG